MRVPARPRPQREPANPAHTPFAPPPLPAVAPKPMGPAELAAALIRKRMSARELARQCARNERTVRSWLSGRERMGVEVSAVVREILK